MVAALAAVGVISGVTLVFVYRYTAPKIQVNVNAATDQAIKDIFPGASKVEYIKQKEVYRVTASDAKSSGYAFLAEGNGYQGVIKIIAGVNTDITQIVGIEILESQETPGLGAEIAGDKFRQQFRGLSITHDIEYVKNEKPSEPYQIEAITGATISSRAVVNTLNKRIAEIKELLKG